MDRREIIESDDEVVIAESTLLPTYEKPKHHSFVVGLTLGLFGALILFTAMIIYLGPRHTYPADAQVFVYGVAKDGGQTKEPVAVIVPGAANSP